MLKQDTFCASDGHFLKYRYWVKSIYAMMQDTSHFQFIFWGCCLLILSFLPSPTVLGGGKVKSHHHISSVCWGILKCAHCTDCSVQQMTDCNIQSSKCDPHLAKLYTNARLLCGMQNMPLKEWPTIGLCVHIYIYIYTYTTTNAQLYYELKDMSQELPNETL